MKRYKSLITGLMVVVFSCTSLVATSQAKEKAQLETITVKKTEVPSLQVFNGEIEAVNKSTLSAQTGGSIEELNYDVGDFVKKGQVIARIKSRTQKAGLRQAQASVGEAKASVSQASASVERARASHKAAVASATEATGNFKRTKSIYDRQLISRAEFDKANSAMQTTRAQVGAAKAQVTAAKAALNVAKAGVSAASARKTQAGEQLGHTEVVAPYSGIVVERHVEMGEVVSLGKPIMTGISLDELRVTTEVPQGLIRGVRKYQQANVYVLGDQPPIPVKSLVFFPYADPLTNAFKVRAELKTGLDGIYPGTFVKVAFVVGKDIQLVIPETAVAYRGEVTGVYVLDKEGMPLLRQVRLGRKLDNGTILVHAGLDDGEVVAKDPVHATLYLKKALIDAAKSAVSKDKTEEQAGTSHE